MYTVFPLILLPVSNHGRIFSTYYERRRIRKNKEESRERKISSQLHPATTGVIKIPREFKTYPERGIVQSRNSINNLKNINSIERDSALDNILKIVEE